MVGTLDTNLCGLMKTDLAQMALERGIRPPTDRTLAKYGIDSERWLELFQLQNWRCAICLKTKATWNTDHHHVPGWAKKPPEERAIYVRGILCWHCNRHVVGSYLSAADGQRIADYLLAYETRRSQLEQEVENDCP